MRLPASYCGIVGFKPSWGVLSRSGLVSYAPACDTIGLMATSVADCIRLFEALLAGHACSDSTATALEPPSNAHPPSEPFPLEGLVMGIPREWEPFIADPAAAKVFDSVLRRLDEAGVRLRPVSVPSLADVLSVYSDHVCMQASSTLARYTGLFLGADARPPVYSSTLGFAAFVSEYQQTHLGPEVLRRIEKGRRLASTAGYWERTEARVGLLQRDISRVFSEECCDFIISPTAVHVAPKLSAPPDEFEDIFTVAANLSRLPALSAPLMHAPVIEETVGTQLIGRYRHDRFLLRVALQMEQAFQ